MVRVGPSPSEWEAEVTYVLQQAHRPDLEAEFAAPIQSAGVLGVAVTLPDERKRMTQRLLRLGKILERL
jgi:predicted protein tyrosine phosphatase